MEFKESLAEVFLADVGIPVGRGDAGVAEHFLNYPQIGPILQ